MKYLIKRNDFLREAKRLDNKSEFLRDAKISGNELYQQLIKEDGWDSHGNTGGGSGPMANDIGWHDSLVGRFLNHLVRKAKVAANLMRIKPLIRRLEGEFDRISAEAYVYKMTGEQKLLYIKSILYSFFWELKEAVEKGEEVQVIINLTEYAIKNLEEIKDEELDERTKEVMLKELELFLEFLKQFKEEEVQTQGQTTTEEETTEETTEEETTEEDTEDPYSKLEASLPTMIKNLSALYYILKNYEKVNLMIVSKEKQKDAQGAGSLPPYVTKGGETIESIQKNLELNKKKLSSEQIIGKNEIKLKPTFAKAAGKFPKEKTPLPKGLELVLEKQGMGEDRNNIRGGEDHLTQAFTKLKTDIKSLIDTKDGKLPISAEFVRILLEKHKEGENTNLIMALYDNINKYLVGSKKQTIQEKDPLYKESYEYLMPKNDKNPKGGKIEVVAEKIARFSKRALQFDGQNLYGGLGDLADPLKKFVETMKVLMKNPIINVKPQYTEPSKEAESKYKVGQEYLYTNKDGEEKIVKIVSLTHDTETGGDKKWLTDDDVKNGRLKKGLVSVILKDKKGLYTSGSTNFAANPEKLKPYVDQKARETKYKKEELTKDIESAKNKVEELKKSDPEKAKKIEANIEEMKSKLDALEKTANEGSQTLKYMEIGARMYSILLELNESLAHVKKSNVSNRKELLKFDRFMSYIKEADGQDEEDSETSASDPRSGMSTSEKIQDYFDKKCMTVKEFTMEKSEFKKVQANFEELAKDKDGFIIDGYDPIIEILKLFNRAYKLYMAKYITKRSTGPGASTAAEYTAYGSNGPFRNDKIFDVWENAVLDIMKQRKYQMIFDKKTKLRVGDELRANGGAQLRKFMTDMLDGDKLYKIDGGGGSDRGAQARLLDSYFGPADEKTEAEINKEGTSFGNDFEENGKISKEIMESATKLKPVLAPNATTEDGKKSNIPIVNAFLTIKATLGGDEVQRTFFIQKIDGNFVYMQYTKAFGTYLPYLGRVDGKKELSDGDIKFNTSTRTAIKYTKVTTDNFELLMPGKTIEVTTLDNDGKEETEKLKIKDSYWLSKEVDGKNIVFKADSGNVGTEESRAKQLQEAIAKNANAGIVNLINTKNNVIVKKSEEDV